MNRSENCILSFGRDLHHRHITAEQDVRNELFALLASARKTYLRDVIDSGKLYHRFVDDFINSHRYIDCDNVVCRNCHEMIIHVVRGILYDYQDYVRQIFSAGAFSLDDCMELKRMYDTSEINSPAFAYDADPMATATSLSFECNFQRNRWQVLCLVPILTICSMFLRFVWRIWKFSLPARRASESV